MSKKSIFINSIVFNTAWFTCILFGNTASYFVLVWALIHLFYRASFKAEFVILVLITFVGSVIDSGLTYVGVLVFPSHNNVIPFWLVMIWLAFAMTLNGCLSPLQKFPLLQCTVGAIFPPLSYLAGASLGAVSFGYSSVQTFLIFSVLWAILLPVFFYLNQLIKGTMNHEHTTIAN